MLQHPIPQNIATYQFHLIGNMTLKQFGILIVGVGLSIALYKSNLLFFIKWPLILTFGLFGIATAFIPYDDRPLDEWFNIYLKVIYSPTQFLWKKSASLPSYFNYSPQKRSLTAEENQALFNAAINKKRAGLSSYLQTISENVLASTLEKSEDQRASHYLSLFVQPHASLHAVSPVLTQPPLSPPPSQPASLHPQNHFAAPVSVPTTPAVNITKSAIPTPTISSQAPPQKIAASTYLPPSPQPQPQQNMLYPPQKTAPTTAATPSKKLPFPIKPTTPNTVVGMVFDAGSNIVENAIIEIRDGGGNPVRATKTNRLGQFFSTTPLKNGRYEIEIDSPPHHFAILKLDLKNQVLDPLEIKATA